MKRNYIVLRDLSQPTRRVAGTGVGRTAQPGDDRLGGEVVRSGRPVREPPEPRIELVEIDERHAAELARDQGAQVCPEMPVSPIEPMDALGQDESDEGPGPTWGIGAIGADKCSFNGQSARVAVIDSGIREEHAAFPKSELRIVTRDFTGLGDVNDQSGHGTHCAATIVGRDVRGRRVGVAPGVRELFVARIFGPGVTTTSATVVSAIQWAVEQGANVISMSLSLNFTGLAAHLHESVGLPVEAATAEALVDFQNNLRLFDSLMGMLSAQENFPGKQGVVIVGAAGNHSRRQATSGQQTYSVPVAAPNNASGVISVGALRRTQAGLAIAPFSNSRPTVVAPGFGILSADINSAGNDLLRLKSGTSMACPHVAGVAALWWDWVNFNGGPVKAQNVISKLRASCKLDQLSAGITVDDRGLGLPVAPAG
jgi:subtilisin family serine protease